MRRIAAAAAAGKIARSRGPGRGHSAKRDEQAARTRDLLLRTAAAFFETHPASELTLPKLARLAGVTPPTAYANFKNVSELMSALYDWVLPHLGTREPLPPPERLHELPELRFPRFSAHAGLLRAVWTSSAWSRHRGRTRAAYVNMALRNLQSAAPQLRGRALLVALGPIISFAYPPMWQWLRDVMGLSETEAERAASWAMRSLVTALAEKSAAPPRAATRQSARKRRKSKR